MESRILRLCSLEPLNLSKYHLVYIQCLIKTVWCFTGEYLCRWEFQSLCSQQLQVRNNYNVTFTYQLMWTLGEGPCGKHCSQSSVGSSGPAMGPENFICEKGCKGQPVLSDTAYSVSAVSQADQWEQGTGSFSAIFGSPGPFTVA